MHEVLVNRLGGLSLPRKSVVRLTDCPYMTLDVYRGRKTTMQQQQQLYCRCYICSAQSRNRYNSGIVLRKVGILTLLRKVGILTLRKTIPELCLRKVRIGTK